MGAYVIEKDGRYFTWFRHGTSVSHSLSREIDGASVFTTEEKAKEWIVRLSVNEVLNLKDATVVRLGKMTDRECLMQLLKALGFKQNHHPTQWTDAEYMVDDDEVRIQFEGQPYLETFTFDKEGNLRRD